MTLMAAPTVVLHLRVVTGPGGGPEKTILNSGAHVDRDRYRLLVAYMHNRGDTAYDLTERAAVMGAAFFDLVERSAFDPGMVLRVARLVRDHDVRILHGHDYKSDLLGLAVRRLTGCQLVTTIHGWVRRTRRERLYVSLDQWAIRRYQRVLAVSQRMAAQLVELRVPATAIRVVHNAIDAEDFSRGDAAGTLKSELGLSATTRLITAVGRLSPEKALDRLIRAVAALADGGHPVHVALVGEGDQRPALEALARTLRVQDRVHLLGHRAPVKPLYPGMDLLCLPSLTEGLPNAVLEAQAMEVPVVATDVGGVAELVQDGETGRLVEPDDVSALARAIAEVFEQPEQTARMVQAARRRIEQKFTFQSRMRRMQAIYDELLAEDARRR